MSEQTTLLDIEPRERPPCGATGGECAFEIVPTTAINGAIHHVPTCVRCGAKLAPVPKPGNENKRRKGTANWKWIPYLRSLHADGKLHCAVCDMTTDEPGGRGEVHHIVPIRADGGVGEDVESNVMWVCTTHHTVIHAERERTEIMRRAWRQREKSTQEGVYGKS